MIFLPTKVGWFGKFKHTDTRSQSDEVFWKKKKKIKHFIVKHTPLATCSHKHAWMLGEYFPLTIDMTDVIAISLVI